MISHLEVADHADIFISHALDQHTIDQGEIRMDYAISGDPQNPALVLIAEPGVDTGVPVGIPQRGNARTW